ncbi:hypothetical protein J437_LFUL010572 [Ladona fulva]|uniref:Reverse transcriptase domain-containing protein n=1 Tax=Ladona fulva TaxID=123851 RepID=A0A8K0NZP7_LADFU|nr:hypothetical protein J437_LFUL010572 [Ladona fulva]
MIIEDKLEVFAENIIGEYQAGFRHKKFWEFNLDLYQLFVDFMQAYDSIDRNKLITIILDFLMPTKLVRLGRATMMTTQCQVKVAVSLTINVEVIQGLKQGHGPALMLFHLTLEHVIRNAGIDTSATLTNKSKQIVGYGDDLNILGRSVPSIKEALGN